MRLYLAPVVGNVPLQEVLQEVGGTVPALERGTEVGADVIVNVTPRVGLVGGVGWMESASEGMILTPGRLWSMTLHLQAVPVRFGGQYAYPLGSRVRLLVEGGTTLYFTRFRWSDRLEQPRLVDFITPWWREAHSDTRGHDFGLHGGVWVDVDLSERFGLLVGVRGTHANIVPLDGEVRGAQSGDRGEETLEGTLRLFGVGQPPEFTRLLVADRFAPYDGYFPNTVREAKLGLSGLRISIGFRIRF